MNKFLLVTTVASLLHTIATAQCENPQNNSLGKPSVRPSWVSNNNLPNRLLPKSELRAVTGSGASEQDAEGDAEKKLEKYVSRQTGLRVQIQTDNGTTRTKSSDELTIKAKSIANYWEKCPDGTVYYSTLWQIAKHPDFTWFEMKNVEFGTDYSVGLRPLIPAFAQYYKGHNTKGTLFLASEIALLGAGGFAMMYANNLYDKALASSDSREMFYSKYESLQSVAIVMFAAAGAVYVWNVIDGYASRPATRRFNVSALPALAPNGQLNAGLAMVLKYKF
jgi:hypothetical protein